MHIEMAWKTIKLCEGELFHLLRGKAFTYTVYSDYLLINNDKRRKISKASLEKALLIQNPTPKTIGDVGCWGPSYIYGIITDKRISHK